MKKIIGLILTLMLVVSATLIADNYNDYIQGYQWIEVYSEPELEYPMVLNFFMDDNGYINKVNLSYLTDHPDLVDKVFVGEVLYDNKEIILDFYKICKWDGTLISTISKVWYFDYTIEKENECTVLYLESENEEICLLRLDEKGYEYLEKIMDE